MSAVDPADALQVGLYGLLTEDATLDALITGVYDHVPENADPPYVVIGEMMSTPDGTHGAHGRQTSVVLHTWTMAQSHRAGNQIGSRLAALLTRRHEDLDVTGHTVWMVEHEFAQTLVDPEPGIRHRVDRFRVWTSQT